jgi:hypothetical protein
VRVWSHLTSRVPKRLGTIAAVTPLQGTRPIVDLPGAVGLHRSRPESRYEGKHHKRRVLRHMFTQLVQANRGRRAIERPGSSVEGSRPSERPEARLMGTVPAGPDTFDQVDRSASPPVSRGRGRRGSVRAQAPGAGPMPPFLPPTGKNARRLLSICPVVAYSLKRRSWTLGGRGRIHGYPPTPAGK